MKIYEFYGIKAKTPQLLRKSQGNRGSEDLSCDCCGSLDIIEEREGYICRDCGIELQIKKFEYHRPYNEECVQYAVLGTTQIGTKGERYKYSNSVRFEKLNKLHSIKENEKAVLDEAKLEIRRFWW